MNKLIIVALIGLFFVSCVSAYYCIQEEDNNSVKEFKSNINLLALQNDIDNGITEEAFYVKLKYFNPCN